AQPTANGPGAGRRRLANRRAGQPPGTRRLRDLGQRTCRLPHRHEALRPRDVNRLLAASLSRFALVAPGGSTVRPRLQRWRGVRIGSNVWIGLFVYIDELHPDALSIGDNCSIGIRTSIITHFYWGPKRALNTGKVVIENDVFIGPHCVILPNVRIGEGAVVQAGTVVSQNVPAHALWGAPSPGPLANATIPLTAASGYADFLRGLKPLGSKDSEVGNHGSAGRVEVPDTRNPDAVSNRTQ